MQKCRDAQCLAGSVRARLQRQGGGCAEQLAVEGSGVAACGDAPPGGAALCEPAPALASHSPLRSIRFSLFKTPIHCWQSAPPAIPADAPPGTNPARPAPALRRDASAASRRFTTPRRATPLAGRRRRLGRRRRGCGFTTRGRRQQKKATRRRAGAGGRCCHLPALPSPPPVLGRTPSTFPPPPPPLAASPRPPARHGEELESGRAQFTVDTGAASCATARRGDTEGLPAPTPLPPLQPAPPPAGVARGRHAERPPEGRGELRASRISPAHVGGSVAGARDPACGFDLLWRPAALLGPPLASHAASASPLGDSARPASPQQRCLGSHALLIMRNIKACASGVKNIAVFDYGTDQPVNSSKKCERKSE
ncbi:atherin-like [Schistocerca gregaria]|uniref:atherin-like n=1 Tax=Schistocerca gregaria TaxID=7010 RepID=UPI00211DE8A9|nr:atherin-like [Schistocerca gregaria]